MNGDGADEQYRLCNMHTTQVCGSAAPAVFPHWFSDINGDGLTDSVQCGTTSITYGINDGTGSLVKQQEEVEQYICQPDCGSGNELRVDLMLDVNGDGVGDIVTWAQTAPLGPGGWYALLYNEGDPTWERVEGIPPPSYEYGLVSANIDGDGFRDIVTIPRDRTSGYDIQVGINTGALEFKMAQLAVSGPTYWAGRYQYWALDVDRDGIDEIVHAIDDVEGDPSEIPFPPPLWVALDFVGTENLLVTPVTEFFANVDQKGPSMFADVDGDSNMDLMVAVGEHLRLYRGVGSRDENLLKQSLLIGSRVSG
jgi:hypothetical protein